MSIMAAFIKVILFSYGLYTMFTTVQSAGLTWFEAQKNCVAVSGQLATINDTIVTCHNMTPGTETLWTGNVRSPSEWIEFQGCYRLNGNLSFRNNISECYQWCLHKQQQSFKYFSYKENQCKCHFTLRKTDTGKNLCNPEANTIYSWVYKVLYNASFDGYGNCVALKCTNGSEKKVAERCASLQIPMCGLSSDNGASISSTTNWNKSQTNCKHLLSTVNNATDICKLNEDTTKTGMWTNIFRVEISSHVDHGDMNKTTDVSSCVIAKCPNDDVKLIHYYTNCNETADAFFCKQVSSSVDVTTTNKPSHTITNITPTMDQHVGDKPDATNIGLICGVTVGGVVLIAVIAIIACKMRNVGPFRKGLYNEDNIEMNNSIDCAIPEYHDTVLNTSNASVPKDAIRNNTGENTSTEGERQNNTYSSNHEYAVVVKKHRADPAGQAAQPRGMDLEEGENQSQRFETEDEYDNLKLTVDKGEQQLENNVYDSSLGVCDGVDPTYNSIKIGSVNNDTTYDHTANIVQKQVNSDTTYDHTF